MGTTGNKFALAWFFVLATVLFGIVLKLGLDLNGEEEIL